MGTLAALDLGVGTRHLCIDMQRLFAEETPWRALAAQGTALCRPDRKPLCRANDLHAVHAARLLGAGPRILAGLLRRLARIDARSGRSGVVAPLAELVPPAKVVDKRLNSLFSRAGFAAALRRRGVDTLVVTGGETDVCVLATVMAAIDLGFYLLLPTDALCSTNDGTHNALIRLYRERFAQQIEATSTTEVLDRWH